MKINKNKISGKILFITGLPGSGKTTIGKEIKKNLSKNKITSIHLDGDILRSILKNFKYTKKERIKLSFIYIKLAQLLIKDVNTIILTTVSLYKEIENYNKDKKNINTFLIIKKFNQKKNLKKKIRNSYISKIRYCLPKKVKKIIHNYTVKKSVKEILTYFG